MREFLFLRVWLVDEDHLLGLVKVGNITVLVDATTEVPCSRPIPGTATDEVEEDMDILNELSPDLES